MDNKLMTLKALLASLLAGAFVFAAQAENAQTNTPNTTATRPAKTLPDQTSVPNSAAPPATTTQTTGQASHDETIKKMNDEERRKVETEGK
jgi:ABC-type oligopeptide transport system substrate-binding subunit